MFFCGERAALRTLDTELIGFCPSLGVGRQRRLNFGLAVSCASLTQAALSGDFVME
jgi:hypothetical protein